MNIIKYCFSCKEVLKGKQNKYCSNKCQKDYEYKEYVINWQLGLRDGNRGRKTRNISEHIRKYLITKFGEKCLLCDWNKRNIITQTVPLEIDHINGNSEDNREENLRLICPNCHSLSSNFRNLNKGKGRRWRKNKYLKES